MKVAHLSEPAEERVVFRDGLGVREARDSGTGEVVEWFHLDPAFAAVDTPLRDRVGRLAKLQHVKFARILSLEAARKDRGPILISSHVPGTRLAEALEMAGHGLITFEPGAGLQILREVLGALAVLHDSRNVAHGALGPERVVITATGRAVVVEHVLAQALDRLQRPRHQLWREWRVPTPPAAGPVRFDMHTDLAQAGILALAVLLGRPLDEDEYPHRLRGLLPLVQERLSRSPGAAVAADVVAFLERLAPVDSRRAFKTVREAQQAYEGLVSGKATAMGVTPARVQAVFAAVAALSVAAAAPSALLAHREAEVLAPAAIDVVPTSAPVLPATGDVAPEAYPVAAAITAPETLIDIDALLALEAELEGGTSPGRSAQRATPDAPPVEAPAATVETPSDVVDTVLHAAADLDGLAQERLDLERQFADLVAAVAPAVDAPVHLVPETPAISEPLVDARVLWSSMPAGETSERSDVTWTPGASGDADTEWLAHTPAALAAECGSDADAPVPFADTSVFAHLDATPQSVAEDEVDARAAASADVHDAETVAVAADAVPPDIVDEGVRVEWWREALPWRDADLAGPLADETTGDAAVETPDASVTAAASPTDAADAFGCDSLDVIDVIPNHVPAAVAPEQDAEPPVFVSDDAPVEVDAPVDPPFDAAAFTTLPVADDADGHPVDDAPLNAAESLLLRDADPPIVPDWRTALLGLDAWEQAPPSTPVPCAVESDAPWLAEPEGVPTLPCELAAETAEPPEPPAELPAALAVVSDAPHDEMPAVWPEAVASTAVLTEAEEIVPEPVAQLAPIEEAAEVRATEPPPAAPTITELAHTEPVPAEPAVVDPAVAEPPVADPTVSDPAVVEPVVEPPVTEPAADVDPFDIPAPAAPASLPEQVPEVVIVDDGHHGDAWDHLPSEVPAVVHHLASAESAAAATATSAGARKKRRRTRRKKGATVEVLPVQVAPQPQVVPPSPSAVMATMALSLTPLHHDAVATDVEAARGVRQVTLLNRQVPAWTPPAEPASPHVPMVAPAAADDAALQTVAATASADGKEWSGALTPAATGATLSGDAVAAVRGPMQIAGPQGALAVISAETPRPFEQEIRAVGMPDLDERQPRSGHVNITSVADAMGPSAAPRPSPLDAWSAPPELPTSSRGINWRRLIAASVLVALCQGAAFAAWWWVQPGARGTLVVHTDKIGVEVLLDDKAVGRTPFRGELVPGRHKLKLREGQQVREMPVEISVGVVTTQTIDWPSSGAAKGSLQVTSNPAGAEIFVNGRSRGKSPQLLENLPAGDQVLFLRGDAGSVRVTTTVLPGETTPLEVKMFAGWIQVDAAVELNLLLNGRAKIGSSMDGQILLPPGVHRLQLVNDSLGIREWLTMTVEPGAVTRVPFMVEPGKLTLQEEAEVFVDGASAGTTPGTITIAPGTHEIAVRRPDGTERRQAMTVRARQRIEF